MGPDWYEREEDRLCEAINSGEISRSDFDKEMRNLNDELRGAAEEAAEQAYNDAMGTW